MLAEKEKRRAKIKGLERHAYGGAVHLGKISPGCRICFTGEQGGGIQIGQECNCKCTVCYYERDRNDKDANTTIRLHDTLGDFFRNNYDPTWNPWVYAFQSSGETLMYIDELLQFAPIFRMIERRRGINIYHYMYSNGTLIDEAMLDKIVQLKVREIRFHLSASKWGKKVKRAMELTQKRGITVSVEEPSYPLERDNILKHLSFFQDVGVRHLNLVEVQLTNANRPEIAAEYPDARIFKDHFYHLYDEGLVYDVMESVEKNGYTFSVHDCNSHVENYRQFKNQNVGQFSAKSIEGMCAPFDYGDRDGLRGSDQ